MTEQPAESDRDQREDVDQDAEPPGDGITERAHAEAPAEGPDDPATES